MPRRLGAGVQRLRAGRRRTPRPSLRDSRVKRRVGKAALQLGRRGRRSWPTSRARTSSVHATRPGIELVEPGAISTPADRADGARARPGRPRRPPARTGRRRRARRGGPPSRVVPAWLDSPVEDGPPALARREHVGDPERQAAVDERLALLDVHLEEAADAARARRGSASSDSRVTPWIARRLAHAPRATASMSSSPVMAWLAKQAVRKRAPSSSTNAITASGWLARLARLEHRGHRLERADDAERAVVGAAVGLRVEVRAGAHARPVARVRRDRPHAARAVAAHLEPDPPRRCAGTTPAPRPRAASTRPGSSRSGCGRCPPARRTSCRNRSRETAGIGSGRIRGCPGNASDARIRERPQPRLPACTARRRSSGSTRAHPHDDFWTWREAMYAAAGRLDPDSAHAVALLAYREMRRRGVRRGGRVPLRRTTAPTGRRIRPPNAMADATIAAAADEAGIDDRAAHDRLRARRRGAAADARASAGSATPTSPPTWRGSTPSPASAPAGSGSRRTACGPCSRGWLEEIARYAEASRDGRPHPRLRAAARDRGVRGRARPPADRAAGRRRPARPRGRRSSTPPTPPTASSTCSPRPARRSARARRPRPTSATATCPRERLFERGIRVCIGTDSNTVIDPMRGAARDRGGRPAHRRAPKRARAGGRRRPDGLPARRSGGRNGAHALGLDPAALPQIEISDAEPELAGVAPEHLPAALVFGGARYRIGRSSTFGTQS